MWTVCSSTSVWGHPWDLLAGGKNTPDMETSLWPLCKRDRAGGCGLQPVAKPEWGTCPTGRWPQFQSLQEKEVSILNSRKCEQFYHKFSRIPSLVRIITSQMICASDNDREKFCYVRTSAPVHLSRGPRVEGCRRQS